MNPSFLAPAVGNSVPELGATIPIVSASNIFLSAASLGLQNIAMSVLGQSVFLPPTYTVVPGQVKISLRNSGGYSFGVRDSVGTLLAAVAPGGFITLSIDNNVNWSFTGTNLEPGLLTLDNTFSATFGGVVQAPYTALDSNVSLHFATLASGFAAFLVDNTGKVVTTPVTVSVTASSVPRTVFRIDSTRAILFYGSSATDHQTVILSASGTTPNLVLSVGTPATLVATLNACWGGEDFTSGPRIAQLATTSYLASFTGSAQATATSVVALSVAGASISIGTITDIVTAAANQTGVGSISVCPLTAGTALAMYSTVGAPTFSVVVITVIGTAASVGVVATTTVNSTTTTPKSFCVLNSTKVLILGDNTTTTTMQTFAATISGASVAIGTRLTVESGMTALTDPAGFSTSTATRYNGHLSTLTTTTALLWYLDGSGVSRAVVLTENLGTVTAGTILYRATSQAASDASGFGYILPPGTSEFSAIVERVASTAGYSDYVTTSKISGTTLTAGGSYPALLTPTNPTRIHTTRMPTGKYVCHGVGDNNVACTAIPVFSSNGDAITYFGQITVPAVNDGGNNLIGVPRAVSFNRVVVLCNPINGTSLGLSTIPLRLLNVEIAA